MTESFRHFARVLFSRNFAHAKFRENRILAKISEFTVIIASLFGLIHFVQVNNFSSHVGTDLPGLNQY